MKDQRPKLALAPRAGVPRARYYRHLECQTAPSGRIGPERLSRPVANLVFQRDDGLFEIGLNGAGPFPTRSFAEAIASTRPPPDPPDPEMRRPPAGTGEAIRKTSGEAFNYASRISSASLARAVAA